MATPLQLADPDKAKQATRFAFTVKMLERIRASRNRRWVYDTTAPGLAMMVTPTGQRSFYFAKRIEGRYRKVKIGDFPGVSIEQARTIAKRHTGKIAEGINVADTRRQARAGMTFGELFTVYLETHAKTHKRTWRADKYQYDAHLAQWAGRRLDQITQADVHRLHAKIGGDAPYAANRALALLSTMFNVAKQVGYTGINPATGVKRFKELQRERFIGTDELPHFLEAVESEPDDTLRDFLKMLLFTGQRRDNVASMRWDELDVRRGVWTIPGDKFKTGSPVEVPIVTQAAAILAQRQVANHQREKPSDYVFPSARANGKKPYLYDPRHAFDRACTVAGITGVRMHDLRRTVATVATMLGTAYPIVAKMLGHKPHGVTAIYARMDFASVREAFQRTVDAMLAKGGER